MRAATRARARDFAVFAGVLAIAVTASACSAASSATPSPTPSLTFPSPSPAPTATLDANGRALPGFVTHSPELPPAQAAPSGILQRTGPGWSLATYRPHVDDVVEVDGITPGFEAIVQVVYLQSPQGQRFQLLELDPATPIMIDSWTAGSPVAFVRQCDPLDCDPTAATQQLNLLTGEVTANPDMSGELHIGITAPNSVRWWQSTTAGARLDRDGRVRRYSERWQADSVSPTGTYIAVVREQPFSTVLSTGLAIVDTTDGTLTDAAALWTGPLECETFRWRVDDTLDISCYDAISEEWRVFAIGPGAELMVENRSATATPPEEGPWVDPAFFVSEGVWAGTFTADADARLAEADTRIGLARNAGFEELFLPDVGLSSARLIASVDGSLYVLASTGVGGTGLASAWRYDVAGDNWTELAPLPPAGPTRGLLASQGSPASGLTSFVVAP